MNVKKEFQKTIREIRKDWRVKQGTPKGEYPKAMTSRPIPSSTPPSPSSTPSSG